MGAEDKSQSLFYRNLFCNNECYDILSKLRTVSILILQESLLQLIIFIFNIILLISLNPYFTGISFAIFFLFFHSYILKGVSILILQESLLQLIIFIFNIILLISLNPYFTGISFAIFFLFFHSYILKGVSILILQESLLQFQSLYLHLQVLFVSILILQESLLQFF